MANKKKVTKKTIYDDKIKRTQFLTFDKLKLLRNNVSKVENKKIRRNEKSAKKLNRKKWKKKKLGKNDDFFRVEKKKTSIHLSNSSKILLQLY